MAGYKSFFAGKQLVYRPSKPLTKFMLAAAFVLSTVSILTLHIATENLDARVAQLEKQKVLLEEKNEDLTNDIADLGSEQSIIKIARAELGLEKPDSIIFQPGT